jgi:hypothetical protein
MVDSINHMPLFFFYCFPVGDRIGYVRVEELNADGSVSNVCRAGARASLSGGGIVIRDDGAQCPEGVPLLSRDDRHVPARPWRGRELLHEVGSGARHTHEADLSGGRGPERSDRRGSSRAG